MKFFILISIFGLVLNTSCTRANNSNSVVRIELPKEAANKDFNLAKSLNFNLYSSTPDVATLSSTEWSNENATGFDGSNPINCYFVTVFAADLVRDRRFACYRNVLEEKIVYNEYGVIAGAASAGETLNVDVSPGEGRELLVFGMHAQSKEFCTNVTDSNFDKSRLSRPVMVGKTTVNILRPEVEVTMALSYDKNKSIDGCDLLVASNNNTTNSYLKTILVGNPSYGEHISNNQCYQIQTYITDASGSKNFNSPAADLTLSLHNNFGTFASLSTCLAAASPMSGDTSFVYSAAESDVKRWIKGNSSMYNHPYLRLASVPSGYTELLTPLFTHTSTAISPIISFPKQILNDTCYPIYFSTKDTSISTSTMSLSQLIRIIAITSGTGTVNFHGSDANCSAGSADDAYEVDYTSSPVSNDLTYFKVSSFSNYSNIDFAVEYNATPTSATTTNTSVAARIGLAEDVRVKTVTPLILKQDASNPSCYGPYRLYLTNFDGVEVNNTYAGSRDFKVTATPYITSGIGFSNDANCTTVVNSVDNFGDFTIANNQSATFFYVKVADQTIKNFTNNTALHLATFREQFSGSASTALYILGVQP